MFALLSILPSLLLAILYFGALIIFGPTYLMGPTGPDWMAWTIVVPIGFFLSVCIGVSFERFDEDGDWEEPLRIAYFLLLVLVLPVALHQLLRLPLMYPLSELVAIAEEYRFWVSGVVLAGGLAYHYAELVLYIRRRRRIESSFAHKT